MINETIQRPSGALAIIEKEPLPLSRIERMPAERYHAIPALSHSGMKDLAISPLRYWYLHLNPERPEREGTPEQKFGTGLHCLVLEGAQKFNESYARMLDGEDYPDCLATIEDLRGWLRNKGHQPKGTRKSELIEQVQRVDAAVPIWDVLEAEHAETNAGKMLCLPEDWDRLHGAAAALLAEPKLQEILAEGEPEVALFDQDPDTAIPLKARLDWLAPDCILDLKTFAQKRGKSIDQSIADAIFYEVYYRQAAFYSTLHRRVTEHGGPKKSLRFIMAFVESAPPHEVRIKELRQSYQGTMNVYWSRAQLEIRHFCQQYRQFMDTFGVNNPWRSEQKIEPLMDEEMRGMAFA